MVHSYINLKNALPCLIAIRVSTVPETIPLLIALHPVVLYIIESTAAHAEMGVCKAVERWGFFTLLGAGIPRARKLTLLRY